MGLLTSQTVRNFDASIRCCDIAIFVVFQDGGHCSHRRACCAVRRLSRMMTRMAKLSSQSQQQQQQQQQRRQNRCQYRRQKGRKKRDSTATTGRSTSENKLHFNYTTHSLPGSFTAVWNLKRYTDGESVNSVKRYLLAQDAHTLHKQRRIRIPRRKTYSKGIADLYQADLVDMTNISRYNDSFRFLLTIIDCFSKMSWVIPC